LENHFGKDRRAIQFAKPTVVAAAPAVVTRMMALLPVELVAASILTCVVSIPSAKYPCKFSACQKYIRSHPAHSVTQSVATTVWSTSIYTSTIYITQDDTTTIVATATSVETVTITRADQPTKARRARALVTSLPESTRLPSRPVSIVTNSPPRGDDVTGLHVVAQCLDDLQTRRADAALLALHKRQATSVVIIGTVSLTTTTTSYTTSTVSASDTYYTTTTVHFTTTTNAADGRPNTSSFTDNRNNTGLSVGAKAGIGVGIGLAVILGLFIAACLWRRRGNRGLHGSSGDEQPEQVSSSTTYHATNNEKLVRESSLAPSSTAYGLIPSSSPSQSLGPYTDRAPQQTSSVAPSDTQKAMYADAQPYEMGTGTIPLHELADSSQGHYMVSSGVRY
jgi:hypothetical protein